MSKGIVIAEQPDAVEVGARILMAGGNAVDAAIACAQGVVDQMNGVAGYGCAQIFQAAAFMKARTSCFRRLPVSFPACGITGSSTRSSSNVTCGMSSSLSSVISSAAVSIMS